MKSPFQRIAALALCFTLTLGAFAYRPSEAKAIAGVDDAVVHWRSALGLCRWLRPYLLQ